MFGVGEHFAWMHAGSSNGDLKQLLLGASFRVKHTTRIFGTLAAVPLRPLMPLLVRKWAHCLHTQQSTHGRALPCNQSEARVPP